MRQSATIPRANPARARSLVHELFQACTEIAATPQAWPVVPRYERHAGATDAEDLGELVFFSQMPGRNRRSAL